jgi:hypothetical protein
VEKTGCCKIMPDTTKLKLKAPKAGCLCGPNVSLVYGLRSVLWK